MRFTELAFLQSITRHAGLLVPSRVTRHERHVLRYFHLPLPHPTVMPKFKIVDTFFSGDNTRRTSGNIIPERKRPCNRLRSSGVWCCRCCLSLLYSVLIESVIFSQHIDETPLLAFGVIGFSCLNVWIFTSDRRRMK